MGAGGVSGTWSAVEMACEGGGGGLRQGVQVGRRGAEEETGAGEISGTWVTVGMG